MVQRTVALCNGKYIGIETIYTVINGRQINIPDKLKELRFKSRNNELFCPCGCRRNLILVAGDKNLKEQHFREKNGTGEYECSMPVEGKVSVDSKIVLKCWLDDKLSANDIESRVPIDTVEDTKRKPEFTFLSRSNKYAIRYWRTRANIRDDRLDVLTGNLSDIKVLYIVDASNGGSDGQYQEILMKLQDRQQYCLLLSIKDAEYDKASMKAVFYAEDIDGLWKENVFAEGKLKEFSFDDRCCLMFSGHSVEQLLTDARDKFNKSQEDKKIRRIEEEKQRIETLRRQKAEAERRHQELECQKEEAERKLRFQREEAEKRRKESEEKQRLRAEKEQIERCKREEEFRRDLASNLTQQKIQVRDVNGNRWIKCEFCGKIAMEQEFDSYGGVGHVNLGTCRECSANNPIVKQKLEEVLKRNKKYNLDVCPECGGQLREKNGQFGRFIGCINFPRCRYTRKVRN